MQTHSKYIRCVYVLSLQALKRAGWTQESGWDICNRVRGGKQGTPMGVAMPPHVTASGTVAGGDAPAVSLRHRTTEPVRMENISQLPKSNPTPPCPQTRPSVSATSPLFCNTSVDGDPTTPCSNPDHCTLCAAGSGQWGTEQSTASHLSLTKLPKPYSPTARSGWDGVVQLHRSEA